jgi:hypothetical protein
LKSKLFRRERRASSIRRALEDPVLRQARIRKADLSEPLPSRPSTFGVVRTTVEQHIFGEARKGRAPQRRSYLIPILRRTPPIPHGLEDLDLITRLVVDQVADVDDATAAGKTVVVARLGEVRGGDERALRNEAILQNYVPLEPGDVQGDILLALIHRSAWKMNSANFAFWGFSEVRMWIVLGSPHSSGPTPIGVPG